VGFAYGAQQPDSDQVEDVPLPGGQGGEISPGNLRRGNGGVVPILGNPINLFLTSFMASKFVL